HTKPLVPLVAVLYPCRSKTITSALSEMAFGAAVLASAISALRSANQVLVERSHSGIRSVGSLRTGRPGSAAAPLGMSLPCWSHFKSPRYYCVTANRLEAPNLRGTPAQRIALGGNPSGRIVAVP